MGAERRQHERKNCFIPCEVEIYGKSVDGTVRNISSGGLSVQVDLPVAQGDVLNVTLQLERRKQVEVQGIVWRDHRCKKKSGSTVQRIGLVLSEAPEAFRELLPAKKPKSQKPAPKPSVVEEQGLDTEGRDSSAPQVLPKQENCEISIRFRVRVKQDSNPRTRSIMVFAADEDEARESARVSIGEGWHILEIDRA
jgi:hypothetical protein